MLLVARGVFVNRLCLFVGRKSAKRTFIVRFLCFGDDLSLTLCGQFWRFSLKPVKPNAPEWPQTRFD